ncbi:MAG: AAA family ATPase [Caldimonas sp.]
MSSIPARSDALHLAREAQFVRADGTSGALEQKDALLLAYLAIEGPTPRSRLAALLWPDVEAERARANLRQRLFRLRKSLGRELLEGGDVAGLCVDIEVHLEHAEAEAGELLQGLDEPVAGELADWLDRAREQRRAGRIRGLAEESARLEIAGQLVAALAAAQRVVDLDATSEHAHRRLMRLHYLRGDRAAALAAFDRCCDVLERTLGVAPDNETEALRARVAASSLPPDLARPRPLPVSVLRPPRLVGRDREWQRLHADWSAGNPSLVAGEAGLGKTRLVTDFALTQPGAIAVDARPGDARVPHTLLSRLLRLLLARLREPLAGDVASELAHLLPELGSAAPRRNAGNVRFVGAVESAIRQGQAGGLSGLVVDDLQFADAASVEAMQQLASSGLGLRWIVAFRAHELAPPAQAFHDLLLGSHGARLQVLQPLAADQIGALIDSLGVDSLEAARLAPALTRHAGGNPMFLLETLKLMLAPAATASSPAAPAGLLTARLPTASNVAHLIEQRIARLSPMAVKLARCAAIAGADFSAELAAHVLGLRAIDLSDAWNELDAAQVLREGAFAHDLIFEAARSSVPTPIARQLHAEMAGFLEARQAEPAHVAQHWRDAGETLKALPWLIAAADRAGSAWRPAEQGALLLLAARIARSEGKDPTRAFDLLRHAHRAHLQSSLGSPSHLECLDLLATLAVDPLEHGYAHFARSDMLGQQGEGASAEAEARKGLAAIADQTGRAADELHVDLVSALANSLFNQDRPGPGADAVRAVEPRMLALGDRHREIEHYANLGVLLDVGNRHAEAQAAMGHVISLARAEGDRTSEMVVLSNLASSLQDVGKVRAALLPLEEAHRLGQQFPELRTSALFVQMQLGSMHRALGNYTEALRCLTEGLEILAAYSPTFIAAAHNNLAQLWLDLGQLARARQHLDLSLAVASGPPLFRALAHLLAARAALAQGRRSAADESLAAARAFIIDSSRYSVRAQAGLLAGNLQEPDAAYASAMEVAREAGRLHMMGLRMDALVFAARAALASERPGVAATHAVEALGLWPEHAPDRLYIGEVWLAAIDSAGDAASRNAILGDATAWIAATASSLPEEFRDSFRDRNAVNRSLLARASARPADC